MALCCVTSATAPVWAQTEWADPVVKISSPNLEQHEGTQQFYIYHPATGKFLTNGNQYGTQLSVGETGQMVTMEWGEERPPLYNTPVKVKGEGWKLNMLNAQSNSGFHEIYVTDATNAYVDCNDQGHTLWQILPQGDNLYRIKIVDQDTIYGKNSTNTVTMNGVWGVVEGSTVVYPFADPEAVEIYSGAEMDWQFVTPEDYDAYWARVELKPMLEEAQEIGLGDQLGEYTEIYNNQASTSEQLETVIANLPVDIIAWQAGEASEEQPANFTAVISNADFTNGAKDNIPGWSFIPTQGYQASAYVDANGENEMKGFAEKWVNSGNGENLGSTFDINQTLSAMPAGKYRLSATSLGYWQADREVTPTGVYLYSVVNGLEVRTEAHTLEYGGTHVNTTEDPATVPQPRAVSMEFVNPERGDIRIGFKTVNTNCNWAAVDSFRLEYLGDTGVSSMADMVQQIVAEFNAQIQDYANNNLVYSAAGEASANALLAKVSEAMAAQVDNDSLSALGNALYTEMATLQTDVDAYTELSTFLTVDVNEYFTGDAANYQMVALNEYLVNVQAELDARTFDPAGIDSVEIIADSLYQVGIAAAIVGEDATNVTGLGVNMDFTGSRNGWTATGDTNHGYGNNTAEEFRDKGHDGFEVYQEITGLPAGSYKVTAQAYYRPAGYNEAAAIFDSADPKADVTVYLDANGAREKVHSIFELTFDSTDGMAGRFATISGSGNELDGKMVADDLASAEAVLTAGDRTNYEVSVIGYVGEDGVLRFGITGEPTTLANSWCLFDNFRIEYLPDDPTGMVNLLETKIDQAESIANGDDMYITDESQSALVTASTNARAALAGELTQEIAEEHNAALDAALALATESDAAMQAMVSAYNSYDAVLVAIEDGDDLTAYDQDAVADLEDAVADQTDYVDGYETYADIAAVNQALADMNNAYGAMVKSALNFTTASKEEPVDVSALIRNPRLQKTVNGVETPTVEYWEFNPEPTNYKAITVDHRLDSLIEYFNFTEFDFHQTLYNMPQGYYTLSVSAFYRYGDMTPAGVAHRDGDEELFAQVYATSEEDYFTPIMSIYEHVMDAKFTSSSAVLPDSLFTYMEPQAYYCVANAVDDANVAFNYGFYRNEVSFYVAEGGTVQVGIRKADGVTNDWCPFDDFALLYLGDGEENNPGVVGVDDVIGESTATVVATEWYTIDGMRVSEPKKGGIYVRVNKMDDGSQKATKVLIK